MKYILIYYYKSKYLGFLRMNVLETDKIIELNKIINDKNTVRYCLYELKKEVDNSGRQI